MKVLLINVFTVFFKMYYTPLTERSVMCQEVVPGSEVYSKIYSQFKRGWQEDKGLPPDVDKIFEVINVQCKVMCEQYKIELESKGSPNRVEIHYHGAA